MAMPEVRAAKTISPSTASGTRADRTQGVLPVNQIASADSNGADELSMNEQLSPHSVWVAMFWHQVTGGTVGKSEPKMRAALKLGALHETIC